jgi:hypothetical protein
MMLGMGFLMMLLVFGLPILLVVLLVGVLAGFWQNRNRLADIGQGPLPVTSSNQVVKQGQAGMTPARYCSHCGAGLHADWSHCPQCGAPIQ